MNPYFFLALTTWKAEDLAGHQTLFPLVDSSTENPISVRTAFIGSHGFSPAIDTQNPHSVKLSGDHLETIALAALMLASLRCDDGFLAGNSLFRFVATVSQLLSAFEPTKEHLDSLEESVAMQFQGLDSENIYEFTTADLKRPADSEQRDDSITIGKMKDPVLHIECKNYGQGVATRMRLNFKTTFLFTSKVNGVWSDEHSMQKFFDEMNLEPTKLYILVVPHDKQLTWLKSKSKHNLQPGPSTSDGFLLVLFEVGIVEADNGPVDNSRSYYGAPES